MIPIRREWYDARSAKCSHVTLIDGGKRKKQCARYARVGRLTCPAHADEKREIYDAQQSCAVIAAWFGLVLGQ